MLHIFGCTSEKSKATVHKHIRQNANIF